MARADKFTLTRKKLLIYTDFGTNFEKNPFTGFLAKYENEDAVKQSLSNLMQTQLGERFYDSKKGSKLAEMLFENPSFMEYELVKANIKEIISKYERRVILIDVRFTNPTEALDVNELYITLVFQIQNILDETFELNFNIKRVR